jgi:predicted secreted hydrolase
LRSSGTIVLDGKTFAVAGEASMQHEAESASPEHPREMPSLQLADGRDALLEVIPGTGGRVIAASGTLVERDGKVTHLGRDDFGVGVGERGRTYWVTLLGFGAAQ